VAADASASWFQDHRDLPHRELVRTRREAALALGATAASRNLTAAKMRGWRERKKPKAVHVKFL